MGAAIFALFILLVSCPVAMADDPKPRLVLGVESATHEVQHTHPSVLVVKATGQVRTLGYSKPTLTRTKYVTPPQDGVQDYQFTAIPPSGLAAQALGDVRGEDRWQNFETEAPWLKGVRILGEGAGSKLIWIKADVVLTSEAMTGKAKVGQVVEVQVSHARAQFPPTDVSVSAGGQVVQPSSYTHLSPVKDENADGLAIHRFRFPATTKGRQKVTITFKLGATHVERTIELDVTES